MSNSRSSRRPATSESYEASSLERIRARAQIEIRRRLVQKTEGLKKQLADWRADFPKFAAQLKVSPKEGGDLIPITQSPILAALEAGRTGRDYVLKPRQVYMTTWELARDIWWFITRSGVNVVILCQSSADNAATKEISSRLVTMFESLKKEFPQAPFAKISDTRWVRTDGAHSELSIVGAGATEKSANKKGRSKTIHRLHVTEVAFFEYAHETLTAILACVPPDLTNTEIIFESTPRGAAGAFYEGYMGAKDGTSGYKALFFRWFEQIEYRVPLTPFEEIVPRTEREKQLVTIHGVSPEQLKWYRQKVADPLLGQAKVDQEFPSDEETCWLFEGRTFFDKEALIRLLNAATPPIDIKLGGNYKVWHAPEPDKQYVVAVDPAAGTSTPDMAPKDRGDPAALVVLERGSGRHMATFCGYCSPDALGARAAAIAWFFNQALIVVERSSSHALVHYALSVWERPTKDGVGYPHVYVEADKKQGFKITPVSRPEILDQIEAAIRTEVFKTDDVELIKEAQLFIVIDDKPEAAGGAHDDRILALAIGWALLRIPSGLRHTEFGQAPSIAYGNVPIAFEGMAAHDRRSVDDIIRDEQKRWANRSSVNSGGGFDSIVTTLGDYDGF